VTKEENKAPKLAGWKFTRGRLKYSVNESFFDIWSSQMAYLLGFTYADGNVYKTSLSWELQKQDVNLLEKFRRTLKCTYPVVFGHGGLACRLRISNQVLVQGILRLGLLPKKKFRFQIPRIPAKLLRHFIRGFLDGDGWISIRANRNEIDVGFTGCNKDFLDVLNKKIAEVCCIHPGKIRKKAKITPNNCISTTYMVEFYSSQAFKILEWIFDNLEKDDLFLDRKYSKYLEAKKLHHFLKSGTRKVRIIQRIKRKTMEQILKDLYLTKGFNGVEIAKALKVHSSSIYRWLAKTGIKYPVGRGVA